VPDLGGFAEPGCQLVARHGGKARFDEEAIMVWKTLASLDAWLALAEKVLAEQNALNRNEGEPEEPDGPDQLSSFPRGSSYPR
jgi:hypothetical protein